MLKITSFVGCRAVWCDVGDHLTAGHGDTVTAHPVVLALPAVVVPDGTAIRERHAHLPAGGIRHGKPGIRAGQSRTSRRGDEV